ncbi:DHA2 family efflux MFS transporter permease subunit [Actinomadura xylanilytica]|uniref:DHA2 family efflux MFS transporter permease subunit n=1 Tax=Actinomadura xylanilytica TaxID=887459 RepID=UPI00255AFB74|nr:DHA2 family efflux MFS transporter permease subunit [Actinomadura xylanilytica]MDL4770580.1 DHA2 family efflux MFS transporter permease subunit [Actinomadura xylanilytica]
MSDAGGAPPRGADKNGRGAEEAAPRGRLIVCVVYVTVVFMVGMDTTIVNLALPAIARKFAVPAAATGAVDVAYLVSVAVCIPLSGWLSDRFGAKRVFLAALAAFTAASVLCGVSGGLGTLVAARVVQGSAGGLLTPVGLTLLYLAYPPEDRIRLARAIVLPGALAPTLGPVVGGLLVEHLSWRWGFAINVPVGAAALVAGALALAGPAERVRRCFDLRGFLLIAPGAGLVMYALNAGAAHGWGPAQTGLGVLGAALVVAFALAGRRTAHPLVDLTVFRDATFRAAGSAMVFLVAGFMAAGYAFTLLFQQGLGASPSHAGLAVFPKAVGLICASQVAGRLQRRFGAGRVVTACMLGAAAAIAATDLIGAGTPLWAIGALHFAMGFCVGQSSIQLQVTAFATIGKAATAAASTLYNAQRQMASALGVSMAAGVLAAAHSAGGLVPYRAAMGAAAGCAVIAALLAFRLTKIGPPVPAAAAAVRAAGS